MLGTSKQSCKQSVANYTENKSHLTYIIQHKKVSKQDRIKALDLNRYISQQHTFYTGKRTFLSRKMYK